MLTGGSWWIRSASGNITLVIRSRLSEMSTLYKSQPGRPTGLGLSVRRQWYCKTRISSFVVRLSWDSVLTVKSFLSLLSLISATSRGCRRPTTT
ncbi:hypothetical protein FOPG_19546 [Fusarium oxysporum f. sp. conglutinans race 2 54008]|uniref:Uncharacterized protein n=1 Tax=Fusarium oxysporum f. sp. conglutinans race 2 54008 TaxID=1089457 RepID=X0HSM0_FUSOX|nr:hypothetical protein FOPG_19546 [Fusarium oxysporum f. sp. conglutinans race 2 54008]